MLTSNFFLGNRKRLLGSLDDNKPVVVFANGLMQRSRDTEYPFEQDRNFFYLTGINLPEWILVMHDGKEYLISPKRTDQQIIFDGDHDTSEAAKISGIQEVVDHVTGLKRLKQHKTIQTNTEEERKPFGVYGNPFSIDFLVSNKIKSDNITDEILKLRTIKSSEELKEIKHAIKITKKGFQAAKEILSSASSEAELDAAITEAFIRCGGSHAYNPIVASGKNACTLHYIQNSHPLKGGGLVLIDVGAYSNYYAADVTRTWVLPDATKRHNRVIEEVKNAFDEIIKIIKPGLELKDYQKYVDEVMTGSLKKLGLKHAQTGLHKYFPHAPSHGLGLDVHDPVVGHRTLQEGMVITLEPGIYIPEEGIGARYEDDLLITKDGVENLSEDIE